MFQLLRSMWENEFAYLSRRNLNQLKLVRSRFHVSSTEISD